MRSTHQILDQAAYERYIRKNETWNLVVNILDTAFYGFASSFIFGSTVLTLYGRHLTDSAMLIGLLPSLQNVGWFLPQLLLANHSQRLPRKKPLVMALSIGERLPFLLIALSILLWPNAPTWFSFTLLATCLALAMFVGGLAAPAWNALMAKVVRPERRGILFGLGQALAGLLGVAGAALSSRIMHVYPYPTSYGICFLLCFIMHVMSWISVSLNREPAQLPTSEAVSSQSYFRNLPQVLRKNTNFCRYLLGRGLVTLGGMAGSFYILYARELFQVSDSFAGQLTMAALLSQTVGTPVLGWLGDRRGHKLVFELCALSGVAAVGMALLAPAAGWFYAVFVLMNLSVAGIVVSGLSINMEFSSPEEVPTFTALANTMMAGPILLAPLLGGWLIDAAGYRVLFYAALAIGLIGWAVMRWNVREPRLERAARTEAISSEV
ncbi:MAG: MFS transporter [Anaerolineae bacterium]